MDMKYPKLRGAIREKFGTQAAFAKALGIHSATLSAKLQGRTDWSGDEIKTAIELLDLSPDQAMNCFFI